MHFQQLDLNLLVALDALLTERNITEAGRRLYVTQSTMSGSLSRLREYFGDEILVQIGRKMVPTPLANSLAGPVHSILLNVQATLATKPGFDPATSARKFFLMMSDYVSTVLMSELLRRVEAEAPNVTFEVLSNDLPNPTDPLDHCDVDLLVLPQAMLDKTQPADELFTDDYACVVWTGNTLVEKNISRDQYMRSGHVCVQFGVGRLPMIDEWFLSRLGITRRVEVLAMNFNSLPQYVVGTRRVATIHRRLANYYCRYLPLRVLDCPFDLPPIRECVQWHRHFEQDPGLTWMRNKLKEAASAVAPDGLARIA